MSRYFDNSNIIYNSSIENNLETYILSSKNSLISVNSYSATGSILTQNITMGQQIVIEAWGAGGSNGLGSIVGSGGKGGYSKTTYNVGEDGILQIVVGAKNSGGLGGTSTSGQDGGRGGGSSYIYFGNTGSFNLLSVAGGGGGGGGGGSSITTGGNGGNSNSNGSNAVLSPFQLGKGGGAGNNNVGGAGGAGNNSSSFNGSAGSSNMLLNVATVTTNLDANGGAGGSTGQAGGGGGGRGFGGGGGGGGDGGAGDAQSGGGGAGGGGNYGDVTLTDGTLSGTIGTPVPTGVALAGSDGYVIISVYNLNISVTSNLIPLGSLNLGSNSFPFDNNFSLDTTLMTGSNILTLSNISDQLNIATATGSFSVSTPSPAKDYVQVQFNTSPSYTLNPGDIIFDSYSATGTISYNTSTGEFSLLAGKSYLISTTLQLVLGNSNSDFTFAVCKSDNTQLSKEFKSVSWDYTTQNQAIVGGNEFIYTPSSNENIKIRTITNNNSALPASIFPAQYSGCMIKEL